MRRHRWLVVIATVMTLMGGLLAIPLARAQTPPDPLFGCDEQRPAIAHHAGGAVLDPQPAGAPIPCMTFVGPTTDSAVVAVSNSNAAFYAPWAQLDKGNVTLPTTPVTLPPVPGVPVGSVLSGVTTAQLTVLGKTTNGGAYWQRVVPGPAPVPLSTHAGVIPWMSIDPDTNRIWYATPITNCGVNVSWSDDEGGAWDKSVVGCPTQGANALIEGPAPAGGAQPSGYAHVVYYCSNFAESPLATRSSIVCHKSLDGGHTFVYNALQTPDSVPAREECGGPGPDGFIAETRVGAVGRDGNLYFPQNVCGKGQELRIAISKDEGATWDIKPVAHTTVEYIYPPALAVDEANNLYIAWRGAGGLPYLTVSRDSGATWSDPVQVGAPSLTGIRQTAITAREPGHIAVSYLGSTDGGQTFNAYITESRNAGDVDPVFWSAAVNAPEDPMALGTERPALGDRIQFLKGMIGPDGTSWAGFHCADTPACPGVRIGVAGRLARPS